MQRGGGRQSLGRAPPAPLVCLGVGRRVSCPPAGRGSEGDAPPPSTQVPSEPSPERWSLLCTGKAHPCPAPSERHSLPFTPALTSRAQVQRALLALTIPLEALQAVKDRMLQAMRKGLSRQTHAQANVRMLPAYICSTPDGTEKGDILVVELCQSHVRTLRVTLLGDGNQSPQVTYKIFDMPGDITQGKGEALFDFIAQCLRQFLAGISSPQHRLPLGFVFPFSCRQTQLDKAELISWSKGFSCSDVEGKDVVQLLQSAIKKQELHHVDVVALMNDTVGTMMTCSMRGEPCEVALIVGTGTNSCFMAEAQLVEMAEEISGQMCVITEWGCFGDDGTLSDILTPYDQHVDQESFNPGEKRCTHPPERAGHGQGKEGSGGSGAPAERAGLLPGAADLPGGGEPRRRALRCWAGCHPQPHVPEPGPSPSSFSGRFGEILQSVTGLLAPECMATLLPSVDGTGQGAAVVTAVALRLAAQRHEVDQLLAPLQLSRADLERVQALMRREMELGLGLESHANASVRMLPTYVRGTPDGTERGEFLALDLGGTNFRVLVVRVAQDGIRMASEIYVIPTAVMQGTGELFNHIIECIMDFQLKQNLLEQVLPLGFTFSFPCQQLGLDKAVLLSWTKGFSASGCVGQDVVQLLREAAQRKQHLGLKVVAVVNDTVGTMMSCGYDDPKCEIGLIVGTGTNACYMEEMRNVGTVEGEQGRMCINMEWGAFGDNGCLDDFFTDFDRLVDEKTINAGKQRFEKLISGMYLGEIVRHILLALVEKQLLFRGKPCPKLQTRDIFQTKFLSTIEIDGLALQQVRAILQDLELQASFEDSLLVQKVCQTVSLRAAQLCAAGLAAVVEKMRENRGLAQLAVTVGVDGTLYKMHPRFSQHLQQMLRDLAPNCTVTFLQSEDGSGKGAALVAAVACRGAEP
uniref:hexokinase n=1 Tax=Accipiter nisus TaxID=211598 RepID=A0A8B9NZM7_9AVES